MKKPRLVSNTDWFNGCQGRYDLVSISQRGFLTILYMATQLQSQDSVLLNISSKLLLYFCISKLITRRQFKLISLDLILSSPKSLSEKLKCKLLAYLFQKVDFFVLYMKDWSGYMAHYRIPQQKFRYIPFKVNGYHDILQLQSQEDGYIFSGGMSKRDLYTLFKAIEGENVPLKLLLPPPATSRKHGTSIDCSVPANVTVIYHDCNSVTWNETIARSKFVVIPIDKDTISSTGISTYLVAMALKKCVIISEGPGTAGVIPEGCAVIVEAGNVAALKEAILKVNQDGELRNKVAEKGFLYASSLGGHERLVRDLVAFIASVGQPDSVTESTSAAERL